MNKCGSFNNRYNISLIELIAVFIIILITVSFIYFRISGNITKTEDSIYLKGFNDGIMAHYRGNYEVKMNKANKLEIYKVIPKV